MKEQLIKLAESLHFISEKKAIVFKNHTDLDYYLWLCELQKGLRGKHEIIIIAYPVMLTHNNIPLSQEFKDIEYSFQIFIDGKSEFIFKDDIFDSFEEALEKGLFEALKLIKI